MPQSIVPSAPAWALEISSPIRSVFHFVATLDGREVRGVSRSPAGVVNALRTMFPDPTHPEELDAMIVQAKRTQPDKHPAPRAFKPKSVRHQLARADYYDYLKGSQLELMIRYAKTLTPEFYEEVEKALQECARNRLLVPPFPLLEYAWQEPPPAAVIASTFVVLSPEQVQKVRVAPRQVVSKLRLLVTSPTTSPDDIRERMKVVTRQSSLDPIDMLAGGAHPLVVADSQGNLTLITQSRDGSFGYAEEMARAAAQAGLPFPCEFMRCLSESPQDVVAPEASRGLTLGVSPTALKPYEPPEGTWRSWFGGRRHEGRNDRGRPSS